jgi:hypothetical protein
LLRSPRGHANRCGLHGELDGESRAACVSSDDDDDALSSLIADSIKFSAEGDDRKLRLFAKRPTQVASIEDQHLPLHVQNPPVPFLSWSFADSVIKLAVNEGDEAVWFATSKPYRDERAALELFSNRDATQDVFSDAMLFGNDLKLLVQSNFAIDNSMSIDDSKFQMTTLSHTSKCSPRLKREIQSHDVA